MAHPHFECAHRVEDGNRRVGRAVVENALAQGLGQPSLTALAATSLLRKKAYYEALEIANKSNAVTPWLAWSAGTTLESQQRT